MIEIRNVERRYGERRAVAEVSIGIQRGEIVGLLGHNGAGKTTLMKMLCGFLEPSAGSLTVGGHDVVSDRLQAQRMIGYLPENAPLYPEMLVQEYLLMMADLRGVPAADRVGAVGRAVVATGLQAYLTAPISTLSKGYRQRVGIAQAILHDPAVLVLDEPTNGLDPSQIQSIRDLIKRLAKRTTILLSTHILQEVEAVCDRVIILIEGRVAADAPLQRLVSSRRVRLSVADGTPGIASTLMEVQGVSSVRASGNDPSQPGFSHWTVDCDREPLPTPEIAAAAAAKGWRIGALTPEVQTLEGVFRRLQAEHAHRMEAA